MCIPLLTHCGTGQPTPAPTAAPTHAPTPAPAPSSTSGPLPGGTLTIPGVGTTPGAPVAAPPVGVPDTGAPTFTLPAAQLQGSSISFTGLHSVTVVTVPLANGSRATALKIMADDVVIDGFMLDVRKATGPSLVTDADRMALHGNVQVYVDSATATANGTAITFGAATPPPGNELPSTLLRVNLGLVGVTADSIVFTKPHQSLHE
jgi:hypothetical protein